MEHCGQRSHNSGDAILKTYLHSDSIKSCLVDIVWHHMSSVAICLLCIGEMRGVHFMSVACAVRQSDDRVSDRKVVTQQLRYVEAVCIFCTNSSLFVYRVHTMNKSCTCYVLQVMYGLQTSCLKAVYNMHLYYKLCTSQACACTAKPFILFTCIACQLVTSSV